MIEKIFIAGGSLLAIPVVVYGIYGSAVLFFKEKSKKFKLKELPKITVFIPTWNEADVIDMRLKNIAELDYPKNKIEVLVVNDRSTDKTKELCLKAFKKYKLKGKIVTNKKRSGVNFSYNYGVKNAKTDIIVTTDADVVFEKKAIKEGLKVLLSSDKIGAVCGELKPVIEKKNIATSTEAPYRNVYGKMCSWESSLESSYCFNGPFIILKKKAFSPINVKRGASDASATLKILQNNYQTKYVSKAKFSELIATGLKEQGRQKIRRATRLLQCTWDAKNLLFRKGWFGSFVFPLRWIMFMVAPLAFFVGWISVVAGLFYLHWIAGVIGLLASLSLFVIGRIKENFLSSFVWHQYYLLAGLFKMFQPNYVWKKIGRKEIK